MTGVQTRALPISGTDAKIRQTIAAAGATAAPIELYQGKVMSWACEAHNCGPHQWAVLIDPARGATDACYHDEDVDAGRSHRFLAGGPEAWRDGNCPPGQAEGRTHISIRPHCARAHGR